MDINDLTIGQARKATAPATAPATATANQPSRPALSNRRAWAGVRFATGKRAHE